MVLPNTERLLAIMARLRDRENGCPWDLEQTYASIAPHTLEEAYEVVEAIAAGDMAGLRDEAGDLLLQVAFYAQMAAEDGLFDFEAVAGGIVDKMIRRHPHIFPAAVPPDGAPTPTIDSAAAQTANWEALKAAERQTEAGKDGQPASVLDGVAAALPALIRAVKLQKRAARVGFDWDDPLAVLEKIREEMDELQQEMVPPTPPHSSPVAQARRADELGDVLFALANLARHLDIDPESALRGANAKFERRFRWIESRLRQQNRTPEQASLEEMETFWDEAKRQEPR